MTETFSAQTLLAYAAAQSAMVQAQERLHGSPHQAILRIRLRLMEQEALGLSEGVGILHDQLHEQYGYDEKGLRQWPYVFARIFDKALPDIGLPSASAVEQWLLGHGEDGQPGIALHGDSALVQQWHAGLHDMAEATPPLLLAADMAAQWRLIGPLDHGNGVVGIMLGDLASHRGGPVSAGGIAAIGMMNRRIRWERLLTRPDADDDQAHLPHRERWRLAWLEALRHGSLAVVQLDDGLRHWGQQVALACDGKRRSSQLQKLLSFIATRSSASITQCGQELGISRQAAATLVNEAFDRQLIREVTHGAHFRRYSIVV